MVKAIFGRETNPYCCHWTIGSSLIHRLLNEGLSPKKNHFSEKVLGANAVGTEWENFALSEN